MLSVAGVGRSVCFDSRSSFTLQTGAEQVRHIFWSVLHLAVAGAVRGAGVHQRPARAAGHHAQRHRGRPLLRHICRPRKTPSSTCSHWVHVYVRCSLFSFYPRDIVATVVAATLSMATNPYHRTQPAFLAHQGRARGP